jgi:hypothetical protein
MGNGRNGLSITDTFPDHGPLHTITGHIALANRGYGIFTPLMGVIDGGGNVARGNGGSAQCLGVPCS